jgi:hypothetical protein
MTQVVLGISAFKTANTHCRVQKSDFLTTALHARFIVFVHFKEDSMKWLLSIMASLALALCVPMYAQSTGQSSSSSAGQPQGTGTSNSSGLSSTGQSATHDHNNGVVDQSSQANSGWNAQQGIEGCIVRENTYYFLQPENGQRIRLNGSDQVSKNEGKHVRVYGNSGREISSASAQDNSQSGNSTASTSAENNNSSGQSQSTATTNKASNQELDVSRVDVISETCQPSANTNSQH